MAVKIRLKRLGKIRAPYYRIVVADSRTKRDGRAIEEIGKYHPTQEPSLIEVNSGRALYWLGVGAQPSEQVLALLKITGDWQKHKGLPGQEGTLRLAAPKVDRKAVFEAAAKETMGEPTTEATTPRKRAAKKSAPAEKPKDAEASDKATSDKSASDKSASDKSASDTAASDTAASDTAASDTAASDTAEKATAPEAEPTATTQPKAEEVEAAAAPAGTDEPAEAGSSGTTGS